MPSELEKSQTRPSTGVLLVGHGTRSELGRKQCEALARQITSGLSKQYAVELAYLELATPTIEQAVGRLIENGAQRLVVAPLLLFAAGHAKEDIPSAVSKALARAGRPVMPLMQAEPLGLQAAVVDLAILRFREAVDPTFSAEETLLLMIGRGSHDAEATAQMGRLRCILQERLGLGRTDVGFLAMAEPRWGDALSVAASTNFRQVVVQPHLLFYGDLLDRLSRGVSVAAAADAPAKAWRMSRVLGDFTEAATTRSSLAQIVLQGIVLAGNTLS